MNKGSKKGNKGKGRGGSNNVGGFKSSGKSAGQNHQAAASKGNSNISHGMNKMRRDPLGQVPHSGEVDGRAVQNPMQCMFMMVPENWAGGWNQSEQPLAVPPGNMKGSDVQAFRYGKDNGASYGRGKGHGVAAKGASYGSMMQAPMSYVNASPMQML